jgi:hypothetical protein
MNLIDILLSVLDQPALQQPAAAYVAAYLKAKLPAGAEKDVKDLLTLIAAAL